MTSRLQDLKLTTQTALEKLRQIKAGEVMPNSARSPAITTLDNKYKATYQQLDIPVPKIRQLQDLWYENGHFENCNLLK